MASFLGVFAWRRWFESSIVHHVFLVIVEKFGLKDRFSHPKSIPSLNLTPCGFGQLGEVRES